MASTDPNLGLTYGWTLGGAVGLAMVTNPDGPATADWLSAGTWEIDIAGQRYAARVSLRPLYDPTKSGQYHAEDKAAWMRAGTRFVGGTIRGIQSKLDYLQGLGVTTTSPER